MRDKLLPEWKCEWCSTKLEISDCLFVNVDMEMRTYEWLLCPACLEDYQDMNEIVPVLRLVPLDD